MDVLIAPGLDCRMIQSRDALTSFCGAFAVFGFAGCLFNAAPTWVWVVFFLLPVLGWLTFGRMWLVALVALMWGVNS